MSGRRTPYLFVLLLLLLSSILPACRQREESPKPVLVRIDDRSVTPEQFRREFERTLPADRIVSDEERSDLERAFLVQVIDRELALAEADRLGVSVTPGELEQALEETRRDYPAGAFEEMLAQRGTTPEQWRGRLAQGLLMEKTVRQAAYSGVTVSSEEVSAYFAEHREEFDRPAQVRARQIVVANEAEAERLLGLLRGGEDFAALAAEHSLSPDGEQGGDLGFFSRGQMPPEFDEVVFSLAPGRLSDLVKSDYGYHIFRVEERRDAVRLSLDDVREEISARLRRDKEERVHHDWLQELRGRAAIEVDWSLL